MGPRDQVALTFDDGPDRASTPAFLDELDRLGWKATFFVLGEMAAAAPELIVEIATRGHELALHGQRHRSHIWRTPADVRRNLESSRDAIEAIGGQRLRFVRPPHGQLSAGTLLAARRLGLVPVLWTTWGRDWTRTASAESVCTTVVRGLEPGATILLHDSDCTSAGHPSRTALGALALLARELDERELRVVPLRDHLVA